MKKIPLRTLIYCCLFLGVLTMISCTTNNKKPESKNTDYHAEHIVQGYLGAQHLANLVYRKGKDGDKFVGWGRMPVTEWNVGSANNKQLVPYNENKRYTNGGCAFDIDGDGFDEIITGCGEMEDLKNTRLIWLQEVDGEPYCQEHEISDLWPNPYSSPHDVVPYARDNFKGILANRSRNEIFLFVIPENPENEEWPVFSIGKFPVDNHSGIELADINGDGLQDIISGNFWIEAPPDPTDVPWIFHRFCNWDDMGKYRWGGMNKHAAADFNNDGLIEIIATEAEIPGARISLFQRQNPDGTGMWNEIPLDIKLDAPHSLISVDVNKDNLPDFIVGEMTAGGWDFTLNPNPKIYLLMNKGNFQFEKQLLYEGWGVHEMRLFPELYNDKIMFYASDEIQPQKFDNMNTHVSFWLIEESKN